MTSESDDGRSSAKTVRERRLAEALRANLRRRKSAERALTEGEIGEAPKPVPRDRPLGLRPGGTDGKDGD